MELYKLNPVPLQAARMTYDTCLPVYSSVINPKGHNYQSTFDKVLDLKLFKFQKLFEIIST